MLFAQLKAELQNEMGSAADSSASGANVPGKQATCLVGHQHTLLLTVPEVIWTWGFVVVAKSGTAGCCVL